MNYFLLQIDIDFNLLYPNKEPSFFDKWPVLKQYILTQLNYVNLPVTEKDFLHFLPSLEESNINALLSNFIVNSLYLKY